MLLERYLKHRHWFEAGFWVAVFALQAAFNSVVTILDLRRVGARFEEWEPPVWELTSILVLAALMPAVVLMVRRFPLDLDTLARNLPAHALASVAYSAIHIAGMVALRLGVYAAMAHRYHPGALPDLFVYEYLKDFRTYALLVGVITIYRFVLMRLQGEARVLEAPDAGPPVEPVERPQRFLVKKLRKEFLIAAEEIEWVQAQGNYVGLRVRGHDYLLRNTLAAFAARLDPAKFVRVHRSYLANLDRVAEIEPLDSGDARLVMKDGSRIPCSRSCRDALRSLAAAG